MPAPTVNTNTNEDKGYEESTWKGHPQFKCKYCPFDSLDEGITRDHVFSVHVRPAVTQRPLDASLFDSSGAQIKTIEVTPTPTHKPVPLKRK